MHSVFSLIQLQFNRLKKADLLSIFSPMIIVFMAFAYKLWAIDMQSHIVKYR